MKIWAFRRAMLPTILGEGFSLGSFRLRPEQRKESLKSLRALFAEDPVGHFEPMVEPRVTSDSEHRGHGSRFWVGAPVHEPGYTCQNKGPRAHRTRLERDVGRRAREAPVARLLRGRANGYDLGMSRRVGEGFASVSASRKLDPRRIDDDASDGDFSPRGRHIRFRERTGHPCLVTRQGRRTRPRRCRLPRRNSRDPLFRRGGLAAGASRCVSSHHVRAQEDSNFRHLVP